MKYLIVHVGFASSIRIEKSTLFGFYTRSCKLKNVIWWINFKLFDRLGDMVDLGACEGCPCLELQSYDVSFSPWLLQVVFFPWLLQLQLEKLPNVLQNEIPNCICFTRHLGNYFKSKLRIIGKSKTSIKRTSIIFDNPRMIKGAMCWVFLV